MAKTKRAYFGLDSHQNDIHVAQSESGSWFYRIKRWDGYGNNWSKWSIVDKEITHPTRLLNKVETGGAEEYVKIPESDQGNWIEWGFGLLEKFIEPTGFRLPH